MTNEKWTYLHPAPIRVWHWINASGFILLFVTGIQIRYAEMFNIMPLKDAIILHNYVGFSVIINYFLWFSYYMGTGKIKIYIPDPRTVITLSIKQIHYYAFGFFVGRPNPHTMTRENKFNPLQQLTYLVVMLVFLPAQMISGVFLWQIKGYGEYINLLGGIKIIDTIHVLLFFIFASFLIVHCYLSTLGHTPLAHVKAMFTGYEKHH